VKKTEIALPYGRGEVYASISNDSLVGVFQPRGGGPSETEEVILRRALNEPIESKRLSVLAAGCRRVVIVISDLTRPCPSAKLLPPLLNELQEGGVADEQVAIVIALGLHRAMSTGEIESAVGAEMFRRLAVVNHDTQEVVHLGTTSRGTPVEIFKTVVEADLRICLGNLEFHYFAGFSGGAKAILPGCASQKTITANHALMVQPTARAGRLHDNPVRQDLEEGAAMAGADFLYNVVLDADHRIVDAVAGEVTAAHRKGCEMVAERGSVPVPRSADIVIVSAGGYPTDLNLYQAQKALDNAIHAVKPGGAIIWLAACGEGFGNAIFQEWLEQADSPDQILDRIQERFVLGGHKAAAIASALKRAQIYLVSDLVPAAVPLCGIRHFSELDTALNTARTELGADAEVTVLPHGASVFPMVCA
jgi:nickel-dependent lactate racemase